MNGKSIWDNQNLIFIKIEYYNIKYKSELIELKKPLYSKALIEIESLLH